VHQTSSPPRKQRTSSNICARGITNRGKRQLRARIFARILTFQFRHRLLNRHEEEYKKWKQDTELCVDDTAFRFDHGLSKAQMGMCNESYDLINSETAKAALARLPASKRNVLISVEQLKQPSSGNLSPVEEARRNQALNAVEFAAKMGRMGTDLRRQMLSEEEEMRMHHFETLALFYEALQRTDPHKYPNKEELAKRAAQSGHSAALQQQLHGDGPGQSASGSSNTASTGLGRLVTPATAAAGVGIGGLPGGPMRSMVPSRDPRLAPARDPRLDRR
jgi:hypothetical protein